MVKLADDEAEAIKQFLRAKRIKKYTVLRPRDFLSSGSALLDLACANRINGAFPKGKYIFIVGDSESGKTFVCMTIFAEATRNKNFKKYRLIYDNIEDGALMNFAEYFGEDVAERVEPPEGTTANPTYSETVERFYYNLEDATKSGPCIYILDSMDALVCKADLKKFAKMKIADRKKESETGDFGLAKAKLNSSYLRQARGWLKKSGSILFIISQTRDNINQVGYGNTKTRAGGRALKFYATLELWTSVREQLYKDVRGKRRQVGMLAQIDVRKNRVHGTKRKVYLPILHSYGIDDIGSCIDWLIDEGHWKVGAAKGIKGKVVRAPEFDFVGKRAELIRTIEKEEDEPTLRLLVQKVWNEIEEACKSKRKSRYG